MKCATGALSATREKYGWRGIRLLTIGAGLLALTTAGIGCTATERSRADKAKLPQPVNDALDRAAKMYAQPLGGATWSKVSLLRGTDHPIYQLQGTNDRGNRVEIEITSAGRIVEAEEHGISPGDVPAAVTEALKAKLPDFTPEKVEAIYQAEQPQPVCYGFEGKDAAGKEVEVYVSADGKMWLN
jgi:hypothetical protein